MCGISWRSARRPAISTPAAGEMGYCSTPIAHGAGDSPGIHAALERAGSPRPERQHAAMKAAGQSTEEYDRNLTTSVRRFLQGRKAPERRPKSTAVYLVESIRWRS